MTMSRIPEAGNLWVGGVWALNLPSSRDKLSQQNVTHVLSVIKYSIDGWGEDAKLFKHMSIDVDDDPESDLLVHFSSAVRFIDKALYPPGGSAESDGDAGPKTDISPSQDANSSPGGVFVHCAMGVSRSVSCVIAYLLYKYPHRFGGKQSTPSATSAAERRQTSKFAVEKALELVRRERGAAGPNQGFMRQLELWWEMGCPADDDSSVEGHPIYQKWLYDKMLEENRSVHMAPDAEAIRFEDEVDDSVPAETGKPDGREVRCKKCRRILATPQFVVSHTPTGSEEPANCAHVFVDTLSWMRPALEGGALEGRLSCPNDKCGATVGRFAWQGLQCSCRQWVVPAFSLNRSRIDEVAPRRSNAPAIRQPPGQNSSL
ncbi:dual specificity protein phosphatase 12 [Hypoxylon sp. FL1284]|nr:dual specificity protein phosphatase 12 [Hypoxylon sp. FL1284]